MAQLSWPLWMKLDATYSYIYEEAWKASSKLATCRITLIPDGSWMNHDQELLADLYGQLDPISYPWVHDQYAK